MRKCVGKSPKKHEHLPEKATFTSRALLEIEIKIINSFKMAILSEQNKTNCVQDKIINLTPHKLN